MLRIKSNPLKRVPKDATFESATSNQNLVVEMLITLNTTSKKTLTGPEVDIDAKILVTKIRPHFFFNPVIVSKSLHSDPNYYKLTITYMTYSGNEAEISVIDEDGEIEKAINHLNNGIERANSKKV